MPNYLRSRRRDERAAGLEPRSRVVVDPADGSQDYWIDARRAERLLADGDLEWFEERKCYREKVPGRRTVS